MTDDLADSTMLLPKPSIWRSPLRFSDLVRGRIKPVPDLRARLAAAALPAAAGELVTRVVRRTRLWRFEKLAVADELIAHFVDGLASGASADELVRDFGDERVAAKLIRRSKRRNRSLVWHAWKWWARLSMALLGLYCLIVLRFVMSQPTLGVDYVAQFNAPVLATPPQDRAWPIYREAILAMGWPASATKSGAEELQRFREMLDARPGEPRWPELVGWVESVRAPIARIREAAAKPSLGFVYGNGRSAADPALGWTWQNVTSTDPHHKAVLEDSLIAMLFPYLNAQRELARLLAADSRVARERHDGVRATADLLAIRGIAKQLRLNTLVDRLVSIGIDELAMNETRRALRESPELFTDAQLIALAHRLAEIGGDNAATVIDLHVERAWFYDILQRVFTDDGHGDGRLTWEGSRALPVMFAVAGNTHIPQSAAQFASTFGLVSAQKTRALVRDEYDRMLDHLIAQSSKPLYTLARLDGVDYVNKRLNEIQFSQIESARLFPLLLLMPSLGRAQLTAERMLGHRDGVIVGIGLELYRRKHGEYPASLTDLTPDDLPRVPIDRITGGALKYRVVNGKALVYSVGVDRDDDGGRVPLDREKKPDGDYAADWPAAEANEKNEGDWVVFGEPTNAGVGGGKR